MMQTDGNESWESVVNLDWMWSVVELYLDGSTPLSVEFTSGAYNPRKLLIVNIKYLFACIKRKEEISEWI